MPKRTARSSKRRVGRSSKRRVGRSSKRRIGRSQRRVGRSRRRVASGNQTNKFIKYNKLYIGNKKKFGKKIKNFIIKKNYNNSYQHQVINKNSEYGDWREGSPKWNKSN